MAEAVETRNDPYANRAVRVVAPDRAEQVFQRPANATMSDRTAHALKRVGQQANGGPVLRQALTSEMRALRLRLSGARLFRQGDSMPKEAVGAKLWIIPDGYLPSRSTGDLPSHESTCVLNLGARQAVVKLTAYYEDREPLEGFQIVCRPRRTLHIRLDTLKNARRQSIPTGVPLALKVESSVPVVVQHTRLDSTQPALALMTTMAFPARG